MLIGEISRTHGVCGELQVHPGPGSSGAWRAAGEVFIGRRPEDAGRYRLRAARGTSRRVVVALEGVDDLDAALKLKGMNLYVSREQLPDPEEGTWYVADLVGLAIQDTSGRMLGVLEEVFDNGAHEIYVIRNGSVEILLPVIAGVVAEVDVQAGRLVVNPPAGLLGMADSD